MKLKPKRHWHPPEGGRPPSEDESQVTYGLKGSGASSLEKLKNKWNLDLREAFRLIAQREGSPIKLPAQIERELNGRFIQKIIDKLCHLSMTDGLTGLPNRLYFMDQLKKEMERARRYQEPCSLVLFDLDKFKDINDRYGHALGDYALLCVAKILVKSLRLTDVVARYGGEEFCMILPDANAPQAYAMAERIREAILKCEIDYKGTKVRMSISAGVAVFYEEPHLSEDRFIEMADKALLEAKRSGRNRVCFFRKKLSLKHDTSMTPQEKEALLY